VSGIFLGNQRLKIRAHLCLFVVKLFLCLFSVAKKYSCLRVLVVKKSFLKSVSIPCKSVSKNSCSLVFIRGSDFSLIFTLRLGGKQSRLKSVCSFEFWFLVNRICFGFRASDFELSLIYFPHFNMFNTGSLFLTGLSKSRLFL